jgi:hypothetical protein
MEELVLQFSRRDPKSRVVSPIMSPDNASERLRMRTSLNELSSINIEQGIEVARAMWFAFNKKEEGVLDIASCITDALVCTRYPVNKQAKTEGTFNVEAQLPFDYPLDELRSELISVDFTAPEGLNYHSKKRGPVTMTAVINTARPVSQEPTKKSWLVKTFELFLRALTSTRAATSEKKDSETSPVSLPNEPSSPQEPTEPSPS